MRAQGARACHEGRRRRLWAGVLAVTLMLLAPPLWAQDSARLVGVVYSIGPDLVQTAWPHACVILRSVARGTRFSTVTTPGGQYSFEDLRPGEYDLTVSLQGFDTAGLKVVVQAEENGVLNVRLFPAGTGSTDAARDAAMPAAERSVNWVNEQLLKSLPLEPGVVRGPDGLLNMRGARNFWRGPLVNSSSVVDPVNDQSAASVPIEAVNGVQATPAPLSSQYGRFHTGTVELDAGPGTDAWRFRLGTFFPRLRWRDGSIWGIRAFSPRATLSGPLARGRAHLFQSVDYRFVRTQVDSLPEGVDDTGYESFDSLTRVDVNLNATNRLTASFSWLPLNLRFVGLDTFDPQEVTPNFRHRGYQARLAERAIFSGGGYLESVFSFQRFDAQVFPSTPGPAVLAGLFLHPDQNRGAWYTTHDRDSFWWQARQTFQARPLRGAGTHLIQAGYTFNRTEYDAHLENRAVTVLRLDNTTSQQILFLAPANVSHAQNDFAAFFHDRWLLHRRVAVDFGVRISHEDATGDEVRAAPRAALVFTPSGDNRTVVRLGGGLFYHPVPLYLGTFTDYPLQVLTRFALDGVTVTDGPKLFQHRVATADGELHVPYTVVWNAQVDRELASSLMLRLGYEQRYTYGDFFIEPFESVAPAISEYQLRNQGRVKYREFQALLHWRAAERTSLFFSYVRSRARGELNSFDGFFGNYSTAIIRPNQRGRLPLDAPDRFLLWGSIGLPWKLDLTPVVDVRSGFPFSAVDEDLNFVGRRNGAGRFPTFFALDVAVERRFVFELLGRKWNTLVGIRVFNVTNHFNPRDVQQVITHPLFGQFFNTVDRQFRAKFEVEL